jgi:pimeloyl-ACP methyl ester carboxylesterase
MPETMITAGDVELCYETFGDPSNPPLLLVMGLGTQMLGWNEEFCNQLAERGFHVIRYDNRDVGRSTTMKGAPPTVRQLLTRRVKAGYTLDDLAADGIALLDALGIERAHVVGASMGGMIAQTMAARRPDRVLSLVSIMSNTGARLTGQPKLSAYPVLLKRAPNDREGYIEHLFNSFEVIRSPGFEPDEDGLRTMLGRSYDRGFNPAGTGRQMAAILASGDRTPLLRTITAPTLVIHGKADKLVSPSGGKATAKAIPGAKLLLIDGMGHDLPRGAWPQIIEAIAENARRARSADAGDLAQAA